MTANRNANATERGCPMPGNAATPTPPKLLVDSREASRLLSISAPHRYGHQSGAGRC